MRFTAGPRSSRPASSARFTAGFPHPYTEAEIRALLNATAQLRPVTGLRLRPHTHATVFGLLASAGWRILERSR